LATTVAKPTASDLASQYGFALSFMNSDPSLKALFDQAVKNTWSTAKFQAMLKASPWYQKNAESIRQYTVLKTSDPATFAARKAQLVAQITQKAASLGAPIPYGTLNDIADQALKFNWNDAQLTTTLGSYVKTVNGVYNGGAATDSDTIHQTAWRNGVNLSEPAVQSMMQQIAQGKATIGFFQNYVRNMAKTVAPGYAAQLDTGMDLYDIANPYIQAKAKILEQNPANIDLFDNDIRNALSSKGADGKPSSMSLWQFEQSMRAKPEWLTTQNANDSVMSIGHKVLQDFGFAS
jgi:hypothetical protein